jgi:hypothetical protein
MSEMLVFNEAVCSNTGYPTHSCDCGCRSQVRNAASAEKVLPLARKAAKASYQTVPRGEEPSDDHSRALLHAARGLKAASAGELDKAQMSFSRAADKHDSLASDMLFAGRNQDHDNHAVAADFHRQAARACGGMTANSAEGVPADPWPTMNYSEAMSPRLRETLANNYRTPQKVNADTYDQPSRQGKPSLAGSPGPHSFDATLGDTGAVEDDSIDAQHDGYWSPTEGRKLSPAEFLRLALEQSEGDRINAHRQGLSR